MDTSLGFRGSTGQGFDELSPRTVDSWEAGRSLVRPLPHVSKDKVERGSLAILSVCFYVSLFRLLFSQSTDCFYVSVARHQRR